MTYTVTQYIIIGPSLFGGTNTHTHTHARPAHGRKLTRVAHPPPPNPNTPRPQRRHVQLSRPTAQCYYVCTYSALCLVPTQLQALSPLVVARRFEPAFRCDPICLVSVLALHLCVYPCLAPAGTGTSTPPRGAPNLGQPCERHVRLLSYNRLARLSNSSANHRAPVRPPEV